MSSLLEEAIVDAKALKEAALKNAETAVLEKYSGDVKKALDTLLEQDEFGLEEENSVDPELTEFIDEVPYAFQNEEVGAPAQEEIIEIDFDALKTRIAEEEAQGIEPTVDEMTTSEEVALDLAEGDVDPDIDAMERDEDDAELASAQARVNLEEDEDINLTEEMLSDLIEELVVDMVPRPQGWASVNSADNSIEQANNDAMAAAMSVNEEEEELEEEVETAPDVVSDAALYEAKISQLTESTREHRALLIESKEQLTRLNLENAKLVYQNKALSSASLNERQKNKIVEAISNAGSVEEAKVLCETLQSTVGSTNEKRTPKSLSEAIARPSAIIRGSRKEESPDDPLSERLKRLAGIK